MSPSDRARVRNLPEFALCAQFPPDMFYYPDAENSNLDSWFDGNEFGKNNYERMYEALRLICLDCPVLQECFVHSMKHEEWGFWAGLSHPERKALRQEHDLPYIPLMDSDAFDAVILANREKSDDYDEDFYE